MLCGCVRVVPVQLACKAVYMYSCLDAASLVLDASTTKTLLLPAVHHIDIMT